MNDLTVASFFSGIGLLDLGLEWAGWRTVSFSEIDRYASRILDLRYPGVPNLGDITRIEHVPDATLWAGGFPCQPVSSAGKRLGQADPRWLWPVWARLIRAFRPRYLLLENVSALLAVNDGRAFGEVLGDLAACGYDAEWDCIPAAALGAPHRRDRIWIVAYPHADQHGQSGQSVDALTGQGIVVPDPDDRQGWRDQPERGSQGRGADATGNGATQSLADTDTDSEQRDRGGGLWPRGWAEPTDGGRSLAHPNGSGPQGHGGLRAFGDGARERLARQSGRAVEGWWGAEPDVGRVAHGVPHRVDRLRCLGNGVVPQVAEFIGRRLVEGLA